MNNRCSDADCKYPDCTCWEDKYSQSVERIAELESELAEYKHTPKAYEIMEADMLEAEAERDKLKQHIADLEADAEVREEANRSLLSFGIKTGMERAAVLVREHGLFAEEHIRKEIEK